MRERLRASWGIGERTNRKGKFNVNVMLGKLKRTSIVALYPYPAGGAGRVGGGSMWVDVGALK